METGNTALQVVPEPIKEVAIVRAPEIVLAEAQKAAIALQDVISKKKKPVMFNGEQYLEFEDWQTIGKFYGLTARTYDAEPFEIDGNLGAKARAEIIDVKTGEVVGAASAWCLRDEPNWRNKPWFQLGSMAQTRAASKAFGNVLRWVVVLAGYRGTPAEEMSHEAQTPSQTTLAAREETGTSSELLHTSCFEVSEPIPSKNKPGRFYRKALDTEGVGYYVHSDHVIADLNVAAGKEVTVKLKKDGKFTSIVEVLK